MIDYTARCCCCYAATLIHVDALMDTYAIDMKITIQRHNILEGALRGVVAGYVGKEMRAISP